MDIDTVKPDVGKRDFLAVLIAGFGSELLPLTSDYGDEPCPKALLPVANKPLIDYVLSWVEQSGIKDVLLICPATHRPAIYHHIHSDVSSTSLRIDLQTHDETQETAVGTCALLRHFSNRITDDFVLVPCDFISSPSLPLTALLNKFRIDSTSHGTIATTCWYMVPEKEKGLLPDEWGPQLPHPSIIWDAETETLLHIDTADDMDQNAEELELKMALISRFPHTCMSSSLRDSHVYVCRRSILELIHQKGHFESFREDFIPWLCKIQYQTSKRQKYTRVLLNLALDGVSQNLALKHSTSIPHHASRSVCSVQGSEPPSPTSLTVGNTGISSFKVGIVVHLPVTEFAIRVNTISTFLDINRSFLSIVSYSLPLDPKNRSLIDQRAQISSDTIVGESTQVLERTTIKRSVIGRHCIIGKGVKISGSILLDHCIIQDGVKLDSCILGKNTKIGAQAELLRCISCGGFEVSAGDLIKGEKLEVSDWTAEPSGTASSDDDEEPNIEPIGNKVVDSS